MTTPFRSTLHCPLAGFVLFAVLGALRLDARAEKQPEDKPASTPEKEFEAARTALQRGDSATFFTTLTPDYGEQLAGQMALVGVTMKSLMEADKSGKVRAKLQPIHAVLVKHGLMNTRRPTLKAGASQEEWKREFKRLLAPVKDRATFFSDMNAAIAKVNPKAKKLTDFVDGRLTKVTITGNRATANLVGKKTITVKFEKIDGVWKMRFQP